MSDREKTYRLRKIRFLYRGTEQEGTLINEKSGMVTIKLNSGYNIVADRKSINIKEESVLEQRSTGASENTLIGNGPGRVTIVTTGGTISSRVDYTTGAVTPSNDISFLKTTVKDLERRFTVELESRENILSENMTPEKWNNIAKWVKEGLGKSHGVIVSHGTDTLSYTASALSFMLEKQSGPVIFVGSQRSPDRPSSDAFANIEAAMHFASAEIGDVGISMHAGSSDSRVSLIRATRSRKMHSSRRDAFKPIGEQPMAYYSDGSVVINRLSRRPEDETVISNKLDGSVGLIYFHPSLSSEDFASYAESKKAVVIMGTGLGHVADRLIEPIREMTRDGRKVIMTTQCISGTTDLNVYSTGRNLLDAGVIEIGNIVPEVAYVKAMYVLGNFEEEEFEKVMKTNLRGEILSREEL